MKAYSLFGILILVINFNISCQQILTVREVYDFEVGDRFDYRTSPPQVVPNGDRITIIGKKYSANQDTITYTLAHDKYTSHWFDGPPHLIYSYTKDTDIMFVTYLDSLIVKRDSVFIADTFNYGGESCKIYINGYNRTTKISDESEENSVQEYGKGIGIYYSTIYGFSPDGNYTKYFIYLEYFKKSGFECGTHDAADVKKLYGDDLNIYPVPAKDVLHIDGRWSLPLNIKIYDVFGRLILTKSMQESQDIGIANLKAGIYFLVFENQNFKQYRKIVKE